LPNICNIEKTHESNYTKSFKPSDVSKPIFNVNKNKENYKIALNRLILKKILEIRRGK
jgi:hypothetical protein